MIPTNLLIVDDEKSILIALKRLLRNKRFDCFLAQSGKEALSIVGQNDIHIILSDLNMPGLNGISLLKKIRKEHPNIVRLILSGKSDSHTVLDAVNDGHVLRYITKPWDDKELIGILRQAAGLFALKQEKKDLHRKLKEYNITLEKKVTKKTRELVKIQNIAEIGKHASQIVHNLNNPLSAVQAGLQIVQRMVEEENPDPDQINKFIQISLDATKDMGQIISSILINARDMRSFSTEMIDLNEVIKNSLTFFEFDSGFRKNIKKQMDLPPDLPRIKGNRIQLKQIFDNLIKNAMDAMAETNTKVLSLKTRYKEDHIISEVSDTGCGIPPDKLDMVFSPGFTTKSIGQGTGLGLASVRAMVEGYHGEIDVWSKLNSGTTFILKLPVQLG